MRAKFVNEASSILRGPSKQDLKDFIDNYNGPKIDLLNIIKERGLPTIFKEYVLKNFTPEEMMILVCNTGDYEIFIKYINAGTKLKIGMINALFVDDYRYYSMTKFPHKKEKIKQYLRDNINNLEEIIHPRDLKKIDKIRELLSVSLKKGRPKVYPRGYKTYRILKYIDENDVYAKRELTKLIIELNYGKGTFNPLTDSSYWSDNFSIIIYPRILEDTKPMKLNAKGKRDLKTFEEKFKNQKIDAYI